MAGLESLVFQHNTISQTGANPILLERHYGATDVSFNTFDRGVADGSVDAYFNMNYGGTTITSLQTGARQHDRHGQRRRTVRQRPPRLRHHGCRRLHGCRPGGGVHQRRDHRQHITNLKAFRRGIGLWNNGPGSGASGDIAGVTISGNQITGDGTPPTGSQGIRILGLHTGTDIAGNTITDVDSASGSRTGTATPPAAR